MDHLNRFRFPAVLLLLAGLFLVVPSCKSKQLPAEPDVLPQALLWKIEHKDLPKPSYLFGTIHLIPKEDYFLPVGFDEAFALSDQVIFEIDLDEMTDMSSMFGMVAGLMMNDGMTLKKLYTKEEYKEVSRFFEDMGMPMFLLNRVKPMFLSMLAELDMDPTAMSSDDMLSYEMEIYTQAQMKEKPVSGLETMEYQMSLFDSIPYTEQADMLLDAIRGTSEESDMFKETVDLYKRQHIEDMVSMAMMDPDSNSTTDYENILLNNRNRNWIPVMEKKMKQGAIMFAVGAGHLGGDQGVVRLLKRSGYTLTPVSVYQRVGQKI